MTVTGEYVAALERLEAGDLSLLRTHAGQGLDETVNGFDLFTGLWWPLRQANQFAPRREVAWLVAKLFAYRPLKHNSGLTLAQNLRRGRPRDEKARVRFDQRFDQLLTLPIGEIEPALRWALDQLAERNCELDWVRLTDDLSKWERETTRLAWAEEYLRNGYQRRIKC
jgi:CRISPR type I-E-associated protein CasB/Cse2